MMDCRRDISGCKLRGKLSVYTLHPSLTKRQKVRCVSIIIQRERVTAALLGMTRARLSSGEPGKSWVACVSWCIQWAGVRHQALNSAWSFGITYQVDRGYRPGIYLIGYWPSCLIYWTSGSSDALRTKAGSSPR